MWTRDSLCIPSRSGSEVQKLHVDKLKQLVLDSLRETGLL